MTTATDQLDTDLAAPLDRLFATARQHPNFGREPALAPPAKPRPTPTAVAPGRCDRGCPADPEPAHPDALAPGLDQRQRDYLDTARGRLVLAEAERMCEREVAAGATRLSTKRTREELRADLARLCDLARARGIFADECQYSLPNDFTSRVARELIRKHSTWRPLFELRGLKREDSV